MCSSRGATRVLTVQHIARIHCHALFEYRYALVGYAGVGYAAPYGQGQGCRVPHGITSYRVMTTFIRSHASECFYREVKRGAKSSRVTEQKASCV